MADIKLKFLDKNSLMIDNRILKDLSSVFGVGNYHSMLSPAYEKEHFIDNLQVKNGGSSIRNSVDSICSQVDALRPSINDRAFVMRKDAIKELLEELAEMDEGVKHE